MSDLAALVLSASFLGAVGTLVTVILAARAKARAADQTTEHKRDRSALGPLRDALDRVERMVQQRDAHIVQLSEAYDALFEEDVDCRMAERTLEGYAQRAYRWMARASAALAKLGEDVGDPEAPPEPRTRPDRKDAERRRRELQQSTKMIQSQSGTHLPPVPPQPPPVGGGGPSP